MQIGIEKSLNEYLRLSDVMRYPDRSGWSAQVESASGTFRCDGRRFFFDEPIAFIATLKQCLATLGGSAELRAPMEYEFIRFTFTELGHVQIQGFFCDYGSANELRFFFSVDQTYIPAFLQNFEEAVASANLHPSGASFDLRRVL